MALDGKTALITGARGDIGGAVAARFRAEGAVVIMTDVSAYPTTAKAQTSVDYSGSCRTLDVTSERDWQKVLAFIECEHGGLDILVNAAGIYQANVDFESVSLRDWKRHFEVNCDGMFLGCQYAGRSMKARGTGGSIINVCSRFAIAPSASRSAYCSSKAAALMLTKVAAEALGQNGIRVNAVLPGPIDSEMLNQNLQPDESRLALVSRLSANTSMKRLATPDDVAETIAFLASEGSKHISGASIEVGC